MFRSGYAFRRDGFAKIYVVHDKRPDDTFNVLSFIIRDGEYLLQEFEQFTYEAIARSYYAGHMKIDALLTTFDNVATTFEIT